MDMICFANDWDGDPLSKQHIMRRLAARGARVLWVNSLGNRSPRLGDRGDWRRTKKKLMRFLVSLRLGPVEVATRIWTMDPIAIPAYGSGAIGRLNGALVGIQVRRAAARLGLRRPIHYTFVPASAWVAGRIDERLLVYHAADEYGAFAGANAAGIGALERALLAKADLYVACSAPLYAKKAGLARRALLIRHGVDHAHFAKALDETLPMPDELKTAPRPIVGFIGLLAEWVDVDLLLRVAASLKTGSLVLVGDIRRESAIARLAAHPNVRLVGRKAYSVLPRYARQFDVALLPFTVSELTLCANPLKLREYLAAGLPVVATDIPEARALAASVGHAAPEALLVARDAEEFVTFVHAQLRSVQPREARSRAVAEETWDHKVLELERELALLS